VIGQQGSYGVLSLRYFMLDVLADPLSGGLLIVENCDSASRLNVVGHHCKWWCGRLSRPAGESPIQECWADHEDWSSE